jgi:hypothetical protein
MRRDIGAFLAPVLAAVLLVIMLVQTRSALQASGSWSRVRENPSSAHADPYSRLDRLIADNPAPGAMTRDPFGSAAPAGPTVSAKPRPAPKPAPPPPPPAPVLTSIVWDADPRATVRWNGHDFSVRENTLFADFRVASIARDAVVLERGGERIVLVLPRKGD